MSDILRIKEQVGQHPTATLEISPEPQLGCIRIQVREPSNKASFFVASEQIGEIADHLAKLDLLAAEQPVQRGAAIAAREPPTTGTQPGLGTGDVRWATFQQPTPTGAGQPVLELVIADLRARSELGVRKYGTELRAHNGRDPDVDAYQEALDEIMYRRQALIEREDLRARILELEGIVRMLLASAVPHPVEVEAGNASEAWRDWFAPSAEHWRGMTDEELRREFGRDDDVFQDSEQGTADAHVHRDL